MTNPIASIASRLLSEHSPNSFRPTHDHRMAKSAYWSHYFSNRDLPPTPIDPVSAARISGYNQVTQWWTDVQGFREWFSNGEEFRQKVEYAALTALDVIQQILQDNNGRTGDRITAARIALEIAGKFPKSTPQDAGKSPLDSMTKEQLEQFISSKMTSLFPDNK